MRFEIRTLSRAISTMVVLFVLVFGAALDVTAHDRGRKWGRSHNRGRHLGWERGRRVGHLRRDNDGLFLRRALRRDRRAERRALRRQRRIERRSFRGGSRFVERSRFGRDRADFRAARFTRFRGGHGRH